MRFKAEFSDGTGTQHWMHWAEAKQQYTLYVYSRMHPVKLPTTYF